MSGASDEGPAADRTDPDGRAVRERGPRDRRRESRARARHHTSHITTKKLDPMPKKTPAPPARRRHRRGASRAETRAPARARLVAHRILARAAGRRDPRARDADRGGRDGFRENDAAPAVRARGGPGRRARRRVHAAPARGGGFRGPARRRGDRHRARRPGGVRDPLRGRLKRGDAREVPDGRHASARGDRGCEPRAVRRRDDRRGARADVTDGFPAGRPEADAGTTTRLGRETAQARDHVRDARSGQLLEVLRERPRGVLARPEVPGGDVLHGGARGRLPRRGAVRGVSDKRKRARGRRAGVPDRPGGDRVARAAAQGARARGRRKTP